MIWFLFAVVIFFVIYFRLYLYLFPEKRLVVLMYHQIKENDFDELTVTLENLEKQFEYLSKSKFSSVFFKGLIKPAKNKIIITFDDGYKNNLDFLPSLLKKYGLKATIFIPTKFIEEGYQGNQMMTFEEIKSLDPNYFEIGLHSHSHQNFKDISIAEIESDLKENLMILENHGIQFSPVLAYPYGKYPKDSPKQNTLFYVFKKIGIQYAVRIGNKINWFPNNEPYKICRIDVKGNDSLNTFKLKLIFGKLKLF